MHVPLAPETPALIRIVAVSALTAHLAIGGVGLVSGAVALAARKGGRAHRTSGTVFVVAMAMMAAFGAAALPFVQKWTVLLPGLFTCYLVASGWTAVRRAPGGAGLAEAIVAAAGLAVGAVGVALGVYAANSPSGRLSGAAPGFYYIVAALPVLAAMLDLKVLRQGGIAGAPRLARHLWRMSLALFIVVTAFIPTQSRAFPPPLHGSPILWAPSIVVLALMILWLARARVAGGLGNPRNPPARRMPLSAS